MRIKKIAQVAILLALAILFGIIENMLPPIFAFLPYAKVGISNIVIIITIAIVGVRYAYVVLVAKCLMIAIFNSGLMSLAYSLPSGIASLTLMVVLFKHTKLSICAVSGLGGVVHNIVQTLVARLILGSNAVYVYMLYLSIFGAMSGVAVGLISYWIIKRLPNSVLGDNIDKFR